MNNAVDVNTLSLLELKALAYDQLVQKERIEKNLEVIMQAMDRKMQESAAQIAPPAPKPEETATTT